ncbi:MAG: ribosome assembly cofactor RimP [Crocinitomicaceae bacterium]|jgi:ribosome maturation factor RimP|nr:ribosome assembly cofactor RimP [Crocinitomicaceae bacterium]
MISKENIRKLAEERIAELGKDLFIVDIKISGKNVIQVELESKTENVAIADCVSVSRNIEHNLDRETQDFELHVSSAGLDQPFRVLEQYQKNIGREVSVQLNDGATIKGLLENADEKSFIVSTISREKVEGKKKKVEVKNTHTFAYKDVKATKIIISFK